MKLDASDLVDLTPLIAAAVRATLVEVEARNAKLGSRLGFSESEAAALLGIERHRLRDARLRGQVKAVLVGRGYLYSKDGLLNLLEGG